MGLWLPFERTAKTDHNPGPMGAVLKYDVPYVLVVCNADPLGEGTYLESVPDFDLNIIPTVPWNHGHGAFDCHAQTTKVISHLHARI